MRPNSPMYEDLDVLLVTADRNSDMFTDVRKHFLTPGGKAVQVVLWKFVQRNTRDMVEEFAHILLGESLRRHVLGVLGRHQDQLPAVRKIGAVPAICDPPGKGRQHALGRVAAALVDYVWGVGCKYRHCTGIVGISQ